MDSNTPSNVFLSVQEFATENGLDNSAEMQHARSTPWSAKIFSLLRSYSRRTLELDYNLSAGPRDLLHLPGNEKAIDTHFLHDGYRLHYRLEGSMDVSSPVLVFCNGLNCDLHMWDATIAPLKRLFPDFRFLRYGRLLMFIQIIECEPLTWMP